jgi:hypothetical protein
LEDSGVIKWFPAKRRAVLINKVVPGEWVCGMLWDEPGTSYPPLIYGECGNRFRITDRSFEKYQPADGDLVILKPSWWSIIPWGLTVWRIVK